LSLEPRTTSLFKADFSQSISPLSLATLQKSPEVAVLMGTPISPPFSPHTRPVSPGTPSWLLTKSPQLSPSPDFPPLDAVSINNPPASSLTLNYHPSPIGNPSHDIAPSKPELSAWVTVSGSSSFPVYSTANYGLRIDARRKLVRPTWLDQDATRDYDPKCKLKDDPGLKPPIEYTFRKRRERVEDDDDTGNSFKRPKTITWLHGRQEGCSLPVTFTFKSERGKAALTEYGSESDNWPQFFSNLKADWESWWNSSIADPSLQDPATYSLRKHYGKDTSKLRGECEPKSLEDVTLGHPAARGCIACFRLGYPCPLLAEGGRYPCTVCAEDDIDCELILEPEVKRACRECGKRRTLCSFREEGSSHKGPCQQCIKQGKKCVAGPKSGKTRTGPSLDAPQPGKAEIVSGRAFVGCTQCRTKKNWCSLQGKSKDGKPKEVPCNGCRDNDTMCTLESLRLSRPKINHVHKNMLKTSVEPSTRTSLKHSSRASKMIITTRLPHPIQFNYQPADLSDPILCHWCDDLFHGLIGLGELEVEVVDHKKRGFKEIRGGHTQDGYPPSRMCHMCTLERLMITACKIHETEPIEGLDPENFDFRGVMDWMMPGMASSAPFEWCSVCPAPAFFKCCKKQAIDAVEGDGGANPESDKGCGLLLCEPCAVNLIQQHKGDLTSLIDELRGNKEGEGYGIRADVDFLHSKGELLRRIHFG